MGAAIYWSAFSWEAFATLATGLAAVLGAYRLGGRQIDILSRQTAMQESQIKISIFERRMDVFRAVERLIYETIAACGAVDDEVEKGFFIAQQEARFLFEKDTTVLLKQVWENYLQLKVYSRVMNEEFEQSNHYGQENIDKKYEALRWLAECSDSLAQHFAAINPIVEATTLSP